MVSEAVDSDTVRSEGRQPGEELRFYSRCTEKSLKSSEEGHVYLERNPCIIFE